MFLQKPFPNFSIARNVGIFNICQEKAAGYIIKTPPTKIVHISAPKDTAYSGAEEAYCVGKEDTGKSAGVWAVDGWWSK